MQPRLPVFPPRVRYGLAAAVAAVIFVASVVDPPGRVATPPGPLGVVGADKWVHFLAYAGLAVALAYALVEYEPRAAAFGGAFLGAALFGLGIELVQFGLPARAFDLADASANGLGAAVAVAAWRSVEPRLALHDSRFRSIRQRL